MITRYHLRADLAAVLYTRSNRNTRFTWCRTTFGFFVRPTPAPGTIIDHSIGAEVLVAVQGPWRLSARADQKTLTDAYLDYIHTVILVTDGEVQRGR